MLSDVTSVILMNPPTGVRSSPKGGASVEKVFVVMHWPKDAPAAAMTRYPYTFKTRVEAEQFRDAASKAEPSYEYLIDELLESCVCCDS